MAKRDRVYSITGTGPAGRSKLCWTNSMGMACLIANLLSQHYTELTVESDKDETKRKTTKAKEAQ